MGFLLSKHEWGIGGSNLDQRHSPVWVQSREHEEYFHLFTQKFKKKGPVMEKKKKPKVGRCAKMVHYPA